MQIVVKVAAILLLLGFAALPCSSAYSKKGSGVDSFETFTVQREVVEETRTTQEDLDKLVRVIEEQRPIPPPIDRDFDHEEQDDDLTAGIQLEFPKKAPLIKSYDEQWEALQDEKDVKKGKAGLFGRKVKTPPRTKFLKKFEKYGLTDGAKEGRRPAEDKDALKVGRIKQSLRKERDGAEARRPSFLKRTKRTPKKQRRYDSSRKSSAADGMNWSQFQRFNTIQAWLSQLATNDSNFAKKIVLGQTFENRKISVVEINTNNSTDVFWIDGGIHGHEWSTPAVLTHLIKELVGNYTLHKELVDSFRWYILPVFNPDGYEYSHTKDRLWRKNRSKRDDGKCVGVDLNRNWNFHWGVGSSNDTCSDQYGGKEPETEESVKAVRDFILNIKQRVPGGRMAAFYTFHASGQLWLTPWGWTREDAPHNNRLVEVAKVAVEALKERLGTTYHIDKTVTLGAASGTSDDWAYGVAKVPFVYSIALPDYGDGYEMSPKYIVPIAEEILDGVKASAMKIKELLKKDQTAVAIGGKHPL